MQFASWFHFVMCFDIKYTTFNAAVLPTKQTFAVLFKNIFFKHDHFCCFNYQAFTQHRYLEYRVIWWRHGVIKESPFYRGSLSLWWDHCFSIAARCVACPSKRNACLFSFFSGEKKAVLKVRSVSSCWCGHHPVWSGAYVLINRCTNRARTLCASPM